MPQSRQNSHVHRHNQWYPLGYLTTSADSYSSLPTLAGKRERLSSAGQS